MIVVCSFTVLTWSSYQFVSLHEHTSQEHLFWIFSEEQHSWKIKFTFHKTGSYCKHDCHNKYEIYKLVCKTHFKYTCQKPAFYAIKYCYFIELKLENWYIDKSLCSTSYLDTKHNWGQHGGKQIWRQCKSVWCMPVDNNYFLLEYVS